MLRYKSYYIPDYIVRVEKSWMSKALCRLNDRLPMVADALPADSTADSSARQASAFPRRVQWTARHYITGSQFSLFLERKKCLSNSYIVKNFEFMSYIGITID